MADTCTSLPEDEHLDVRNMSKTCFEHPSVHPQEDWYIQFYGIFFMYQYKQYGRCQDVFDVEDTRIKFNH